MKISIIGTGGVGVALGDKLRAHRSICYGTRDTNSAKVKEILSQQQGVLVKPIAEAVDSSDVVIVAVPGAGKSKNHRNLLFKRLMKSLSHQFRPFAQC